MRSFLILLTASLLVSLSTSSFAQGLTTLDTPDDEPEEPSRPSTGLTTLDTPDDEYDKATSSEGLTSLDTPDEEYVKPDAEASKSSPTASEASRFILGGFMGVSGQASLDTRFFTLNADLDTMWGAYLQVEQPLARNFILGARLGLNSFKLDLANNEDSGALIWLGIVPKLRLPVSDSTELNLSVGIGTDAAGVSWHISLGPVFNLNSSPVIGVELGLLSGSAKSNAGPVWEYSAFTLMVSVYFPMSSTPD